MMFVKEMHKEYDKKEQIDKIKFSEKAKLIGKILYKVRKKNIFS